VDLNKECEECKASMNEKVLDGLAALVITVIAVGLYIICYPLIKYLRAKE